MKTRKRNFIGYTRLVIIALHLFPENKLFWIELNSDKDKTSFGSLLYDTLVELKKNSSYGPLLSGRTFDTNDEKRREIFSRVVSKLECSGKINFSSTGSDAYSFSGIKDYYENKIYPDLPVRYKIGAHGLSLEFQKLFNS